MAGDALEAAVVLCIHTEDMTAFERNFAQLKPYYTDFRCRHVYIHGTCILDTITHIYMCIPSHC